MGDVKYHAGARCGASRRWPARYAGRVDAAQPEPPRSRGSGAGRHGARGGHRRRISPGRPQFRKEQVLAILIHGDAAFPGQGVVAETLNLSRLAGYDVGGIIHIIANNQLGFTAEPHESFSTSYASGLARGFKIPIMHVNADDPVACIEAARLAWAYRQRFEPGLPDRPGRLSPLRPQRRRRAGVHAAADLPDRRRAIRPCASCMRGSWPRAAWCRPGDAEALVQQHIGELGARLRRAQARTGLRAAAARRFHRRGAAQRAQTAVPLDRLRASIDELLTRARGIHRAPQARTRTRATQHDVRARRPNGPSTGRPPRSWRSPRSWRMASPIRLTGEDVERGTFSHRHAVLHDAVTGGEHVPLRSFSQRPGGVRDSQQPALRERRHRLRVRLQHPGAEPAGAVGRPVRRLHQRRAGDPRRVPHLGPREVGAGAVAGAAAAARLRRARARITRARGSSASCNAAADTNMRIANCTTAAQYFHLLRRQALLLDTDPLPLIVHDAEEPAAPRAHGLDAARTGRGPLPAGSSTTTSMRAAGEGAAAGAVQRQDLRGPGRQRGSARTTRRVALMRVEQLYPFPADQIRAVARRLSEAARGVLGPGRAGEHGRVGVRAPAARAAHRRALAAAIHRPGPQFEPLRGLVGLARGQPARDCRAGVRGEADQGRDRVLSKQVRSSPVPVRTGGDPGA